MAIVLTVFANSPDRGRGLARDMRVRWALEELGLPYQVRPISFADMKQPDYLAQQPFGQIPLFEDGALCLFESGAIVLHLAQQGQGLLSDDPVARARAMSWIFAALNTVEPPIFELSNARLLEAGAPWAEARLPVVQGRVHQVLAHLGRHLHGQEWLDGAFSAGDLMMVSVLARLGSSGLLAQHPRLAEYIAAGQARPAFQRAFAAQRDLFLAQNGAQT